MSRSARSAEPAERAQPASTGPPVVETQKRSQATPTGAGVGPLELQGAHGPQGLQGPQGPVVVTAPAPLVSETTLPSWPFEVGATGVSCAAACGTKGLVCDEEEQGRATYGRAVVFDAMRVSGVAQKGRSEDEWLGPFRVRDQYTSDESSEVSAMPGLWMEGHAELERGTPNWKSAEYKSVPSTCAARHAGLRRVCACKALPPPFVAAPTAPWTAVLSAGERATGLATRFVYERAKGLFPNTAESTESTEAAKSSRAIRRYLMPESARVSAESGTYVLVLELEPGALDQLTRATQHTGVDVRLIKVSSNGHPSGDPEIVLTREKGFRVYEGSSAKEIDAPAYYAGTKLAYINDRRSSSSEMIVRSGANTIAINMHASWPGGPNSDGLMELQFHDVVQRAVFLWGPGIVAPDVAALKAEV